MHATRQLCLCLTGMTLLVSAPAWAAPAASSVRNEADLDAFLPRASLLEQRREEIAQDPTNETLYMDYASIALAINRPEDAAWAMEELIRLNPKLDKVRLDLSLVYFGMKRYEEARILLESVSSRNPPPIVEENIRAVLARIELAQQRHRLQATLTVGINSESNANAAPSTGNVSVLDTTIPLGDGAGAQSDLHAFSAVGLQHSYDAGELFDEYAIRLKNSAMAYGTEHQDLDDLNLQLYTARTGVELIHQPTGRSVEVAAGYNHLMLNEQSYLRNPKAEVIVSIPLDNALLFRVAYGLEYRDYRNSTTVTFYRDRAGQARQFNLGLRYLASARSVWNGTISMRREDARQLYYANDQTAFALDHTYAFAPEFWNGRLDNWFINTRFSYKMSQYDTADTLISNKIREDKEIMAQAMVGYRISNSLTVSAGYSYTDVISNIVNYHYDNHRYTVSLSKSFSYP